MEQSYLSSVIKQFEYYKSLGDKTFAQVSDEHLFWQYNDDSNSIATIVYHVAGNMLSRWTDFLTSDGEKDWRNRDAEFENTIQTREALLQRWEEGWACLFNALNPLTEADLDKIVYIRNQGHTVTEAINRQLAHYPYHIGQLVFLGKMLCQGGWQSLSIPKGNSQAYNAEKFSQEPHIEHFTDEIIVPLPKEKIKDITDYLAAGLGVYLRLDTGEVQYITEMEFEDSFDDEDDENAIGPDQIDLKLFSYIEKWSSREAFEFMADFARQLNSNPKLQNQLFDALEKRKPFQEFKYIIDRSGEYKDQWFAFRDKQQQAYVIDTLRWMYLNHKNKLT